VTTIVDSVGSAAGSFLWTIPLALPTSSAYRIRIISRSDTALYDFSDQFTITKIPSTLTITAPSSSANWNTGTSHNLSWSSSGNPGTSARLALYNGDSLVTTIANSVGITAGLYNWTIPWALMTSSAYRIKITSINDTSVYDFSDNFSITHVHAVTVTSPSTGATWNAGSSHYISWNSSGNTPGSFVTIYLCDSTTELLPPIASDIDRSSVYYYWTLPTTLRGGGNYRIKIVSTADTAANGYSGPFTIAGRPNRLTITSPAAGAVWIADDYYTIYWSYTGPDLENSYVRLELYDSSSFVDTIASSRYATSGSFLWQVPSPLPAGGRYRIKIASTTLDTVFDFSDSFTITNPALIGDSYEPDSTYVLATLIAKGDSESHTLSSADDEDWLKFNAVSGTTYTIETHGSTDTYLDLFGTDGVSLLLSDDDSGSEYPNAKIVWTCPASGTYYCKAAGWEVGSYTVTLR
jgi:hypothetical protein